MKFQPVLTITLLAAGLAAGRAQDVKLNLPGSTPAPAAAAAPTFTDAQLLEELGWYMGKRAGLTELGFSATEAESLLKGFGAAAGGKDSPYDLDKIGPKLDEYMRKKQEAYVLKMKQQSLADAKAFFDKLKENKNIVELPSGLRYEIVTPGTGPFPKPTDTVKVHYTGTLLNGTVFDTSLKPREPGAPVTPAEFELQGVIPGWTEGIQKINKGGKIKLYIPSSLAYGDTPPENGPIPPGATLIFDVELLDIKAPAATTPALPAPGK
jgi:FKBP-type peptidyl-prolyl cis-trans isomerase